VASFAQAAAQIGAFEAAASPGAEAAANAMAGVFKPAVQAVLLARRHAFSTQTPSAPGTPPAAISGEMAGSMLNEPAYETGPATWLSQSGPTAAWSRIQELGGWMEAHTEKGMRWQQPPGAWHKSMGHSLPPRPYMKPTAEALSESGELTAAAAAAFGAVVAAVT
jgi:hypothetical protein